MSEQSAPESLSVSHRELWLIRQALQDYLATLSHNEGDLIGEVKTLLQQLPSVGDPDADVNKVFPEGRRLTL